MINIADLAITSVETIDLFDINDGSYLFTLDELQDVTVSQSQDKEDVTGKGGRKLTSMKRNKAVTVSGTNGVISSGLLEMQTGSEFETGDELEVLYTDYLTVKSNAATTKYTATGTTGAQIVALYVRSDDGTVGTEMEQATAADTGKFAYAAGTKALTFKSGEIEDGTQIVVKYYRKTAGSKLTNMSDVYSKKAEAFINVLAENKCGKTFAAQIHVFKGDFNGEFDLEMGDGQTVHEFEFEALAGSCTAAGGALWEYTVFGIDEE